MNRYILGILTWLLLCTQALAVTISPLILEINTDNRLTSQLLITNNSTHKLALEASVYQLIFKKNGEVRTSQVPNESILIFPPAALLEAGKKQAFRLQWINNEPLETSKSYFIRFSTASLRQDNDDTMIHTKLSKGINIQLNYNALLHVYSSSQHPDIKLKIDDLGKLTLTNSGDRFTFTTALFFKNLDHDSVEALYQALGAKFIPPQSTITFNASEQDLPVGTYYGYEH